MSLAGLLALGAAAAVLVLASIGLAKGGRGGPAAQALPPPAPRGPVAPAAFPYRAFTTEFDLVCMGDELARVLAEEAVDARIPRSPGPLEPAERRRQFDEAHDAAEANLAPFAASLADASIMILFDQSGSMAEAMPRIAGGLLAVLERLEAAGAETVLAGFTTVGWKGGRARQRWLAEGRPLLPGRLCDLLHVVFSPPGEGTTRDHLAPLLDTSICFENVDGEAVAWAERVLLALQRPRRCLVVVSDGAPVDDSTLSENRSDYLWNHLVETLGALTARGSVALGGVGLGHRLGDLYPEARMAEREPELAPAVLGLVGDLLGPQRQRG